MPKVYNNSIGPCYELWRAQNGLWYWHFIVANGNTIADGGEGYHNRADAERGIAIMKDSRNATVYYPKA